MGAPGPSHLGTGDVYLGLAGAPLLNKQVTEGAPFFPRFLREEWETTNLDSACF
jgi:hypothetical protein